MTGTGITPASEGAVGEWTGGTWDDFTSQADEVFGADLEKGDALIGVPFGIVKATFRYGNFADSITGMNAFYVSLDVIIASQVELNRAKRRRNAYAENIEAVEPGEHLVFNESGTGVYRQVVQYLNTVGLIKLPEGLPEEGKLGESRYDILPSLWEVSPAAETRLAADGTDTLAFNVRLLCPRGLRASEYENERTKKGKTRYIA
jgi:hypothetical protein